MSSLPNRTKEGSRLAKQPKSLIVRRALERLLANQRRDRRLARLTEAATALEANAAIELAEEALPLDNESLSMAESAGAPLRNATWKS